MGCGQSRPAEGGDAAAMCRERTALLADAIRHRYALADAHRSYAASLHAVAAALPDFLHASLLSHPAASAAVRLPDHHKKVDDDDDHIHFPSSSSSSSSSSDDEGCDGGGGGHIRFPSDDDAAASPAPPPYGYGQSLFGISYARSQPPPPSVSSYEHHRPQSANATLHYAGAGAPPSPPRVSVWDFFNPFDSFESYYHEQHASSPPPTYTPSSRSPSNDEGHEDDIPKLENDAIANGSSAKEETTTSCNSNVEAHRKSRSSEASTSSTSTSSSMVSDVNVVQKSVMEEQLRRSDVAAVISRKAYDDDSDVVQEIRSQFEDAAKSAVDVSRVLEVGKMPYYQRSSGLKVSSMLICGLPSAGDEFLKFEEEKSMEYGNLSSTLQKLYMWEKKLLEEVKAEEKMRVLYDQKRQELKVLYGRGAEARKLEATEIHIRKLSTKISIVIQMWHAMSKCHQIQCHALSQAKNLDSKLAGARFSEAHMDLIKRLELQLLELITSFAAWVNAQKNFVGTLNEWLKKGIDYVPEVTDDGIPPFSPGRLGAPPIFTICNNWAISMGRIPEKEVVDTMQTFASSVLNIWEKHRLEWRQGMMANRDMDRDLRVMERDELSMRKALDAQCKKLVLVSNQSGVSLSAQVVQSNGPTSEVGLQSCMNKVFEAMENFTAACSNAYNDLHLRSEEEKTRFFSHENGRVP
uniref:DUF632 domain-containing protein n=1 Tax=Leersia perrieri TaxID=77586 RepID=A0A0D9XAM2_9ORYZ